MNPLSKTGHPTFLNDARLVALLPELFKLTERIVQQQFMEFIEANKLLSSRQSCYKKGHSTQTALISVLDDAKWAVEKCMVTILVLFDFSKAFECIPHKALLTRLQRMGITGLPLT